MSAVKILPGTGSGAARIAVEGAGRKRAAPPLALSTTSMRVVLFRPMLGRIA